VYDNICSSRIIKSKGEEEEEGEEGEEGEEVEGDTEAQLGVDARSYVSTFRKYFTLMDEFHIYHTG